MKEINIAQVIIDKRREKGITQGELASYIGVSKASVSKWETRQSYPDVTFLPQLATYFSISLDELMGYEPQMAKEGIRKLYHELSADFANKPFDEVLDHCREIVKKYFSCFPLLFQIGSLLVNYSMLSGDSEKTASIIAEAKELFIRVKKESDDVELAKQALNMEALCLLSLDSPKEVLELLGGENTFLISHENLLASAYQMTGKTKEAKAVLQIGAYQYMFSLIGLLQSYLTLCTDDAEAFYEGYRRIVVIVEEFNLKGLHPAVLLTFYLIAVQGFLAQNNMDKALDILEEYVEIATGDIYPLELHGDGFFNLLDDWFADLELGTYPPRDEKTVRQSMLDSVASNPAFNALAGDARFQHMVERLKNNCQEVR